MLFPDGQTATFITRTKAGEDELGQPIWSVTEVDVPDCGFAPSGSTELVQGQDTVIDHPAVYVPEGVTLPTAIDAVRVGGIEYEVDGKPQPWQNPFTGWAPGGVIDLENATG